jgi:hypothetical protein
MSQVILLDENPMCFVNRAKDGTDVIGFPLVNQTLEQILDKVYQWISFASEGVDTEIEVDSNLPIDGIGCLSQDPRSAGEKLVDILKGKGLRAKVVECI